MDITEFVGKVSEDIKLLEHRKYLFVSPHPDDAEIGCGATMKKLSGLGKEVYLAVVTDGRKGYSDPSMQEEKVVEIRKQEQLRAARILGVKEIFFLGFEDLGDYRVSDVREKLIALMRRVKPDVVFTVDPYLKYEVHPDHIKVGLAAMQASLFSGFPSIPPKDIELHPVKAVALYLTSSPNTFVCVDAEHESKLAALKEHESQFSQMWEMIEGYVDYKSRECGKVQGCKRAEGFKVLPTLFLHVFPDADEL